MKIVVYSHRLEIGGAQINAIDLAAAVRDRGHDVTVLGEDGPAASLVRDRGLRLVKTPPARRHPSPSAARVLMEVVRSERVDLVHAYEHQQCLDAYYGPHLLRGVPVVFTVLSMEVPRWFPRNPPLVMGTKRLQEQQRRARRGPVYLMEPPIDTEADRPGAVSTKEFIETHVLGDGRVNLVVVSRLVEQMKLDGIRRAIGAVKLLASELGVRLVVVGGGTAFDLLAEEAEAANVEAGDRIVVMTGPLLDPRPAYEMADVVLGMGSSALRAMAFAKPLVVVGEEGFSEIFNPETAEDFLWTGFGGHGSGSRSPERLARQITELLSDRKRMVEWADLGRRIVVERFSLGAAAEMVERLYRESMSAPLSRPRELATAALPSLHLAYSELVPANARHWLTERVPASWKPQAAAYREDTEP